MLSKFNMSEFLRESKALEIKEKMEKLWLIELEKLEIEFISNNKRDFPEFSEIAKLIIDNWEDHLKKQELRKEMFESVKINWESIQKIIND